jgi:hypothetical protein
MKSESDVPAVAPVGAKAEADGEVGFIDQAKHPSWWVEGAATPQVGDRLRET